MFIVIKDYDDSQTEDEFFGPFDNYDEAEYFAQRLDIERNDGEPFPAVQALRPTSDI